jgi:hypothetical protein
MKHSPRRRLAAWGDSAVEVFAVEVFAVGGGGVVLHYGGTRAAEAPDDAPGSFIHARRAGH